MSGPGTGVERPGEGEVRWIEEAGVRYALFVTGPAGEKSRYYTRPEDELQVGVSVRREPASVPPHHHPPRRRVVEGFAETVVVRSGRCLARVYREDGALLGGAELEPGDIALFLRGGHGFVLHEPTELVVVRQGPADEDGKQLLPVQA